MRFVYILDFSFTRRLARFGFRLCLALFFMLRLFRRRAPHIRLMLKEWLVERGQKLFNLCLTHVLATIIFYQHKSPLSAKVLYSILWRWRYATRLVENTCVILRDYDPRIVWIQFAGTKDELIFHLLLLFLIFR